MSRDEFRRVAAQKAHDLLMAAVNEPWEPADMLAEHGEEYVEKVTVEIIRIAGRLGRQAKEKT